MSLTLPDIGRIAHLARLELDQAHAERMLSRLNGFFDLVEQMQAVDTAGVEPLAHPTAVIGQVDLLMGFIEPFLKGETPKSFFEQ